MSLKPTKTLGGWKMRAASSRGKSRMAPYPPRAHQMARASGSLAASCHSARRRVSSPAR